MMLPIHVFGELELADLVHDGFGMPDHLVSIGNPWYPWGEKEPGTRVRPEFRRAFHRVLRLSFRDVSDRTHLRHPFLARIPEVRDARRVVEFWRRTRHEASGYVVHCWAGIARSTATALALLYLETGSEAEAARLLQEIRPQAQPNLRLVRCFDHVLGSRLEAAAQVVIQARAAAFAAELASLLEELPAAEEEFWEELPAAEDPGPSGGSVEPEPDGLLKPGEKAH
jgi:predicted protein tyrosine phosphatase